TGSLVIEGSVGKGAKICIKDGTLVINGSIDQEAEIDIKNGNLTIMGEVRDNTFISLGFPTQFSNIELKPSAIGQIFINENIGQNVKVFAYNDIAIKKKVGAGAILLSTDGNIRTGQVSEFAVVIASRGEVIVDEPLHPKAHFFNASGKIKKTNSIVNHSIFANSKKASDEKERDHIIDINEPYISPAPSSKFQSKLAWYIAGSVAITG